MEYAFFLYWSINPRCYSYGICVLLTNFNYLYCYRKNCDHALCLIKWGELNYLICLAGVSSFMSEGLLPSYFLLFLLFLHCMTISQFFENETDMYSVQPEIKSLCNTSIRITWNKTTGIIRKLVDHTKNTENIEIFRNLKKKVSEHW